MGEKKYLYAIFAAMAALILTAFIGAGVASATVLCNEATTSGCKSYGKGAIVDGYLAASATFSTTEGSVLDTCTGGRLEGSTSNAGGSTETVKETIEELTWEECTKTTDTTSKGELEIHWISGSDNATVTGKNISVTINTAFGSCTYGTGEAADLGTLKGGSSATMEFNAVVTKQAGSAFCPADAKFAATYTVTSPQALFIGESSAAAAPTLHLENTGGPPKFGTRGCKFAARFEICKFTVTNTSAFAVIVTIEEITGFGGRYNIISTACNVGTELGIGKSCTGEIKLEVNPGVKWTNGYLFQVEEKGSGGANKAGIYGFLTT